ncbi:S1/P1 nuclease [Chromatocurvus halotolerans]|uniref:S1/P1 nuclease n=1 Tax=Chromatocurvus halotolerans TaxID=1132028 RepID=A0A4R2KK83_9GAMM|nr:S1/P1 nuclease [Chromatocurvus halotolerans]TCO73734.1 S1/P1 nuclease [Chromatocurvus halotolerans]
MKTRLTPLLLFFFSVSAFGWGATGHRAAAGIAERYLSPEARLAIADILGQETLVEASTWPDFMRSDPSEFWQRTASPWHYVTVPEGKTYEEVGAPREGDAYSALQKFSDDLRAKGTSAQDRALALRFIVHIIGDLHQPLHAGNGTDRGGNDARVTYFGQSTNLHRLWDSQIIDSEQLAYSEWVEWLDRKLSSEEFRAWNDPDPLVWIAESAALRDRIYPEDPDLGWDYRYAWTSTIQRRISQAGVRTAAYLNALFDGGAVGSGPGRS